MNNGDNSARLSLQRFADVARIVTGLDTATVQQGITWLEVLVKDLNVPPLSKICDIKKESFASIAQSTAGSSSTKGNPVLLTEQELVEILERAF